jgi:glycosyltransferase involved in cell wall biosynthesis
LSRSITFFTICARNYLALASALAQSIKKHHADADFTIWLLDQGELPDLPRAGKHRSIVDAVAKAELDNLLIYYDILELATAVKPRCFQRHLDEGCTTVIYLDPDILVFRPLEELFAELHGGASGVLTPHILAPLPKDKSKPDDLNLLSSGIYNLGFLALQQGRDADALLAWWWGWLKTHCYADPATGTFTDQKWMNFAPLFWPRFRILRDTTYNVAYWNLPQRVLAQGPGPNWTVDGRPLAFFHFSGFDPGKPQQLSKHQDRIEIQPGSPLANLLGYYAERLYSSGHAQYTDLRLAVGTFQNGVAIDRVARMAYRDALARGRVFTEPLNTEPGSFYHWLCSPVGFDPSAKSDNALTHYLLTIYGIRPDLRQAYPDVYGADRDAFLAWVREYAVEDVGAHPELLKRQLKEDRFGVNLIGYLRAELGIAEVARGYARALQGEGLGLRYVDTTEMCGSPAGDTSLDLSGGGDPASSPFSINVIHVNADQLPYVAERIGRDFFSGRYNIGVFFWETPIFPEEWHDRFELVDEIWVTSGFMADSIGRVSPVPVIRMPLVLDVPPIAPDRARFGLSSDEFLFLFYFDFHSIPVRKNPQGTIEAFRRAFRPDEPVRLVLKSINGRSRPEELERLKRQARGLRVSFIDDVLSGDERFRLLNSCDCFISLHRAEGFGLGIAEAMALGKPAIATGWSGNMDFMTADNSFTVRYKLEALEETDPPYEAGTIWANPDLDEAAQLMRVVFRDKELAQRKAEQGRQDILRAYGRAEVGKRLRERLDLIHRRGWSERRRATTGVRSRIDRWRDPRGFTLRGIRGLWRFTLSRVPSRYKRRLIALGVRMRRRLLGY